MDALAKGEESDLLEDAFTRRKIGRLPDPVKTDFLRNLTELADQETDSMLTFIEQSRRELKMTGLEIQDEQIALKRTSQLMARDMDNDPEHDELQAFLSRRPRDVQSAKRKNSIYEVQQKLAVERYIRKRDKKKGKDDKLARESTMDVEVKEAIAGLRVTSARVENERARQAEIARQRKEKKKREKAGKEGKAIELLEQADETEKIRQKDKERQEQKVKELLEERKNRRIENSMLRTGGEAPSTVVPVQDDEGKDRPSSGTVIQVEAAVHEDEKKKKKKKKKKDKADKNDEFMA